MVRLINGAFLKDVLRMEKLENIYFLITVGKKYTWDFSFC